MKTESDIKREIAAYLNSLGDKCPCCGQPLEIRRSSMGAIDTNICDRCYYERFAGQPSEDAYFASDADFWREVEART